MGSEMEDLVAALDAQRRHVLGAIEGLDDDQLRKPVLPSGWSCSGMLKHLALADEHYWFRSIVGGQSLDFFPQEPNADWIVGPDEAPDDMVALYRHEIAEANTVLRAVSPDDPPLQRDPLWDTWGIDFPTVRYIVLHMISETACHAGHVDAARELLDGKQWLVL